MRVAAEEGYTTILWSADTIDWRDQDADLLVKRTKSRLKNGGFLLMHPTKGTVKALPEIIDWIEQQGFEIKPVSQMISFEETAR